MALNAKRKPIYSELTDEASERISNTLISSEWFSKQLARSVEKDAQPFEDAGVGIVCDAFVSMSKVPPFQQNTGLRHDEKQYQVFDTDDLKDLIEELNKENRFTEIVETIEIKIAELKSQPQFHCMIRHVLESIRRIAHQADSQNSKAKALGLPSSLPISRKLIDLHLLSFSISKYLDKSAVKIQAAGVPILCQDVPPIGLE